MMELSDLSSLLDNILLENGDNGIIEVLTILIELSVEGEYANQLRIVKSNYQAEKQKYDAGIISNEEFNRYANKARSVIYPIIYSQDDQWIVQGWEDNDIIINLKQKEENIDFEAIETENEEDFIDNHQHEKDSDNEIAIPKGIIIIPKQLQSLLNEEEQKKYRRNLSTAQSSIRCGDYSSAYDICAKLFNELDNNSVQLQELLLVSLYKKVGVQGIVKEYLEGNGTFFLKIKLYVEKIKELSIADASLVESNKQKKEKNKQDQATLTSDLNIRLICRSLINEVRKCYTEKTFGGRKFDYFDQQEVPEVRNFYTRVIQLAMGIYSLYPMATFFGKLMIELTGGGFMNWLKVDPNLEVQDRENLKFSPLYYRRILYEEYAPKVFAGFKKEAFNKTAAYILLKAIRGKYINVKKTRYKEWSLTWNAHYRSLQSFLIGYAIYGDDRFLEKPLRELSGKAGLTWIDINESGDLITAKHCANYLRKFDAVRQLKTISNKAQFNNPDEIMKNVTNSIVSKKLKLLKESFIELPDFLNYKNNKNEIKGIIKILNMAKVCYSLSRDLRFLHFGIDIINNKQKMVWIIRNYLLDRIILSNSLLCLYLKFDALLELRNFEALLASHISLPVHAENNENIQDAEIMLNTFTPEDGANEGEDEVGPKIELTIETESSIDNDSNIGNNEFLTGSPQEEPSRDEI